MNKSDWRYLDLAIIVALSCAPLMMVFGYVFAFEGASARIGAPDAGLDYLMAFLWALVILVAIVLAPIDGAERKALIVLWIVRIGVVLGFMFFYESHYPLDAFGYFQSALRGEYGPLDAEFGHGTLNIKVLAAIHNLVLPGSYQAMKITWSAIGLVAVFFFYRAACALLDKRDIRFLYLIGLIPSVVFWGSILGKDPITLLGIAMFIYGVIGFDRRRRPRFLVMAGLGLALATWIRLWLGLIFLLPLGIYLLSGKGKILKTAVMGAIGVPALFYSSVAFQQSFRLENTKDLIYRTNVISQSWAFGGSAQVASGVDALGAMALFAPLGAFTALFRPLPGEVLNAFGWFAGVENGVVLALFVVGIARGYWRRLATREGAWLVATVVVWSVMYGFASYQNLGTAVRFKVQVIPILVMLLLLMFDEEAQARRRAARLALLGKG